MDLKKREKSLETFKLLQAELLKKKEFYERKTAETEAALVFLEEMFRDVAS